MGYFSNIAIEDRIHGCDHSVTLPEQQLLWRLSDLQDRLEEVKAGKVSISGDTICTKDILRYAPVTCFGRIFEIEAAIELAIADLEEKYGICASAEPEDENNGEQLSLFAA